MESPLFIDIVLLTIYVLLAVAVVLTVWSTVRMHLMHKGDGSSENGVPKGRIAWLTAGVLVVTLVVTWLTASTQPLNINGRIYDDALWLRMSDMLIHTAIVLVVVVAGAIAFSAIRTRMKA